MRYSPLTPEELELLDELEDDELEDELLDDEELAEELPEDELELLDEASGPDPTPPHAASVITNPSVAAITKKCLQRIKPRIDVCLM